jgi:LPS O-antigen subunit length determinant protein (WzzB/FepE family)
VQTLQDIAPYVAAAALAVALVLAMLLVLQWRALRRLRRAQTVILGSHDEHDIVEHVQTLDSRVRNLREAVELLTGRLDDYHIRLDEALTNQAIVRYDAFRDAGGEQSASLALLDNHRSGIVVSTIAARDFARLYVKHLDHGVADRELSPEERRAVDEAVPRPLTPPPGAGRGETHD